MDKLKPFLNKILCMEALELLKQLPDNSVDTVLTDPPYALRFGGNKWDYELPSIELFQEMLRVAKPGTTLMCFGSDRTHHRIMCNIEDAGWQIKTCIYWIFGSGFPKSLNISKKLTNLLPSNLRCVCDDHSKNKDKDSQSDCQLSDDLCDAQLPSDQDSDQDVAPLQDDAPVHNRDNLDEDVLDKALKYNLDRSSTSPLSIDDCAHLLGHLEEHYQSNCNKLVDILMSKLRVFLKENHKKESRNKDKYDSVSDSVSLTYTDTNISDVTRIYQKCPQCKKFYATQGFGSALKPASEIIAVAQKPLEHNYSYNMLKYGVAGLNIDAGRIPFEKEDREAYEKKRRSFKKNIGKIVNNVFQGNMKEEKPEIYLKNSEKGRWPGNIILDEEAARLLDEQSGISLRCGGGGKKAYAWDKDKIKGAAYPDKLGFQDIGGASRFFKIIEPHRFVYTPKPSQRERNVGLEDADKQPKIFNGQTDKSANKESGSVEDKFSTDPQANYHPTQKPLKLIEYLCKLTKTPTGGIVLDPFVGSGTTAVACRNTGRDYICCDLDENYCKIAKERLGYGPLFK